MTYIEDMVSRWPCAVWIAGARESKKLILIIVAIALLLDNMLLTTVVPIIPEFLYNLRHEAEGVKYSDPDLAEPTISTMPAAIGNGSTAFPPCVCPENNAAAETNAAGVAALAQNQQQRQKLRTRSSKHQELVNENVEVGVMFASKAFVQLVTNPFIGPLTNRIGYSIPMFAGFVIMFFSTIVFAFGRSYSVLFIARAIQGVGSSCSSVAGMGMLADRYPDDRERGNAMGIALGGVALGVLIGPPFGGVMYQWFGKSMPFIILALVALGDGLLQLMVLQPGVVKQEEDAPSLKQLLHDPFILITAGAITFGNIGIAMLEPSLPIWMMDTMDAPKWQLGAAFLPASISYLIGTNLFGPLGHKIGRWLAAMIGLIVIGICLMCIPLATSISHLIGPNAGLGFAIGMVDSSMMPELGYLVDIRHTAVYGSVYAIGDVALCLGYAIGPAFSGTLVKGIGFEWMLVGIAMLNFAYAPLLFLLRNPPPKDEIKRLMEDNKCSVRYVNYQNDEEQ